MQVKRKLKEPSMPNFVIYDDIEAQPREGGFKPKESFPISKFSKEEAYQYAEWMKETFIKHWESKQ